MFGGRHHETTTADRRSIMVEDQIRRRGVRDVRVLDAMLTVPRELFVPEPMQQQAFDDKALAIPHGQTISQPYIVAHMTEQLDVQPTMRVLEIGTGTGYQCAILSLLASQIHTVERIPELSEHARRTLNALGVLNVSYHVGDGTLGLPPYAPFDRILVTAAAPQVPRPLLAQLADGGKLLLPVGDEQDQQLVTITRRGEIFDELRGLPCRFVKLVGEEGWIAKNPPTQA